MTPRNPMKKSLSSILFLLFILHVQTISAQWTWQNPLPNAHPLWSVTFVNENTGYTTSDLGTIKRTDDGGQTWTIQNSGTTNTLRDVSFADTDQVLTSKR